jgi:hypothetical protein
LIIGIDIRSNWKYWKRLSKTFLSNIAQPLNVPIPSQKEQLEREERKREEEIEKEKQLEKERELERERQREWEREVERERQLEMERQLEKERLLEMERQIEKAKKAEEEKARRMSFEITKKLPLGLADPAKNVLLKVRRDARRKCYNGRLKDAFFLAPACQGSRESGGQGDSRQPGQLSPAAHPAAVNGASSATGVEAGARGLTDWSPDYGRQQAAAAANHVDLEERRQRGTRRRRWRQVRQPQVPQVSAHDGKQ